MQSTVKEILKKCKQAVSAHKLFDEKYNEYLQHIAEVENAYKLKIDMHGNREEIIHKISIIKDMLPKKHETMSKLNASI